MAQEINFVRSTIEPTTPKPGIYYDVPFSEYLTWNAFSKSMMNAALRSHAHLNAYINSTTATRSLTLGSLVDCKLLEPHTFDYQFVERPATYIKETTTGRVPNKTTKREEKPWSANANSCKEIIKQITDSGRRVVSPEMMRDANSCIVAAHDHVFARGIITTGKKQVSLVWECEHTGVLCKGRMDLLDTENHGGYAPCITDVKTTESGEEVKFGKYAANFDYNVQGGTYSEAWNILAKERRDFRLLTIETGKVSTMLPDIDTFRFGYNSRELRLGRLKFKRACEKILEYSQRDEILGTPPGDKMIELPMYALREEAKYHGEEGERLLRVERGEV